MPGTFCGGIPRHDLGVYLYRWQDDDYNDMAWAIVPPSVIAGNSINVNGYTIENVGTTTIQPRVEWYLTRGIVLDSTSIPLANVTYSPPLPPFSSYNPDTVTISLPIPVDTLVGSYYTRPHSRRRGFHPDGFSVLNTSRSAATRSS